ncbi:hypothetical protein [uncultured Arthrobacter sp.]|uniref:hypothetical protein n=1 Tax=uncultured Arthrobacter sp. TaxID=114050 RepID=UPI00262726E5|nr:hypothetical protein [uncultured Arthrobacter sp.]
MPRHKQSAVKAAREELERTFPARQQASLERYRELQKQANIDDSKKWENGASDHQLKMLVSIGVGAVVIAAWLGISGSDQFLPFLLSAVPFVVVLGAFAYGAHPHGTQKQRVDAATAILVYISVIVFWLVVRQSVRDQVLLTALDTFAIFGQLASFIASVKESVLAWIEPSQFRQLSESGKQARRAQRELNNYGWLPDGVSRVD